MELKVEFVVVALVLRPTNSFGHSVTWPRFKVSSERLKKPGIEPTTPVRYRGFLKVYVRPKTIVHFSVPNIDRRKKETLHRKCRITWTINTALARNRDVSSFWFPPHVCAHDLAETPILIKNCVGSPFFRMHPVPKLLNFLP